MSEPLARSARGDSREQTYREHIEGVYRLARAKALRMVTYLGLDSQRVRFVDTVCAAALLHDFGKLEPRNQCTLRRGPKARLPVPHVDAGVAQLLELGHSEAAILVHAHHGGLKSLHCESARDRAFRDDDIAGIIDGHLSSYWNEHRRYIKTEPPCSDPGVLSTGLDWRLALSCLVDADHSDASGLHFDFELPNPRWKKRLHALDDFVKKLADEASAGNRTELRGEIYEACRSAETSAPMYACDSPVGSGKTTAIMAHLLRVAEAKKLRRIFIVLPYTSIIQQSVKIYRKALVLAGENPELVVAEHHHQADYEHAEERDLATLWRPRVIVTTAVQFFESLANNHPSRLRKIHQLPGSAVFIDETHAAIPNHLWPQTWSWLTELRSRWSCYFVFASGSLARFWELREFVDHPEPLPELVAPEVRRSALAAEQTRVRFKTEREPLPLEALPEFVISKPGPRLVILNTVQSAAIVARTFRDRGISVLHLSTALCPRDREQITAVLNNLGLSVWAP